MPEGQKHGTSEEELEMFRRMQINHGGTAYSVFDTRDATPSTIIAMPGDSPSQLALENTTADFFPDLRTSVAYGTNVLIGRGLRFGALVDSLASSHERFNALEIAVSELQRSKNLTPSNDFQMSKQSQDDTATLRRDLAAATLKIEKLSTSMDAERKRGEEERRRHGKLQKTVGGLKKKLDRHQVAISGLRTSNARQIESTRPILLDSIMKLLADSFSDLPRSSLHESKEQGSSGSGSRDTKSLVDLSTFDDNVALVRIAMTNPKSLSSKLRAHQQSSLGPQKMLLSEQIRNLCATASKLHQERAASAHLTGIRLLGEAFVLEAASQEPPFKRRGDYGEVDPTLVNTILECLGPTVATAYVMTLLLVHPYTTDSNGNRTVNVFPRISLSMTKIHDGWLETLPNEVALAQLRRDSGYDSDADAWDVSDDEL